MVPSAVEQLEEALNQRELAEEKFKAKMKEVVKKLKEETIQLAELRLQQRPPKQPKRQIDLNVEDTSDLENLFGRKKNFFFLLFFLFSLIHFLIIKTNR